MTVREPVGLPMLAPSPAAPWRAQAAFRGMDPELFFPQRGDQRSVNAAKAVCAGCPVRAPCLADGLTTRHGIWGGLSERERRATRRRERGARDAGRTPSRATQGV